MALDRNNFVENSINMSLAAILNDDWSDYEDRKKKTGNKCYFFQPTMGWEVNYYSEKIKKHCPELNSDSIKIAINSYSRFAPEPHIRENALKWIIKRLEVSL